jgi:hypothetical protein
VSELQASMTQAEFQAWGEFYRLFPFDDLHRYHRPAALIASRHGGALPPLLEWLQPNPSAVQVPDGNWSEADLRTFKALGAK